MPKRDESPEAVAHRWVVALGDKNTLDGLDGTARVHWLAVAKLIRAERRRAVRLVRLASNQLHFTADIDELARFILGTSQRKGGTK